jgi:DNA-binding MarR family transcriptional regulator
LTIPVSRDIIIQAREVKAMEQKKQRSEAQKAADKRYYEKTRSERRYITLHVTAKEREEIDRVLAENNITALELFRKAIKELKEKSNN